MPGEKPITTTSTDLDKLPDLIERAMQTLEAAQSSAEVLDARNAATYAYDAAKAAERLAKAKGAHDEILDACHKMQAEALLIESRAKMRLAEEYTTAQERGEVRTKGGDYTSKVPNENLAPTAADIGLTKKDVHEARQLLDGERRMPGVVKRTLEAIVDAGKAPTRAAVKRAVAVKPKPPRVPIERAVIDRVARQIEEAESKPATSPPTRTRPPVPISEITTYEGPSVPATGNLSGVGQLTAELAGLPPDATVNERNRFHQIHGMDPLQTIAGRKLSAADSRLALSVSRLSRLVAELDTLPSVADLQAGIELMRVHTPRPEIGHGEQLDYAARTQKNLDRMRDKLTSLQAKLDEYHRLVDEDA